MNSPEAGSMGETSAGEGLLKVLFVEDLAADAELAVRALRTGGFALVSELVDTKEAFSLALESFLPDLIISDYTLPGFNGLSALSLARARDPSLPFIVLTGSMNESTAVECMRAGASDYVIKEHLGRLPFAVRDALDRRAMILESARNATRLKESEERYRALFEDSGAVKLIIEPQAGIIVEANQAACDFYGWPQDVLVGKRLGEINSLGIEGTNENLRRRREEKRYHFVFKHRRADGSLVDVEVYSSPIVLGGRPHLFSIVHDISARMAAERERDELSSKLGHYLSTSPTVTYSLRIHQGEARWQWVSENIVDLLGYSLEEALEGDWWLRNVHSSDRMRALGGIAKLTQSGAYGHEYRFRKKSRDLVWLRDEMRLVPSDRGEAEIVGTLTDISDRKTVESELSLKSIALEAAANAVLITDRDGVIQWANPAFETLTGFSRAEALGKNANLLNSGRQDKDFYRGLWEVILSGRVWQGEIVNRRKDGALYTEEMTITPVLEESRSIRGFIAIKSDVSERKRALGLLESSLEEKEVLLREIHHRVINNMQLMNSILSLSSQKIVDPSLREQLGGISRRFVAMALVHEQFYTSPDMARIDLLPCLRQLAEGLSSEFPRFTGRIEVVSDRETVPLSLDKAIPAGLTASELLTNALTHAYPAGSPQGGIRVSLRRVASNLELSVRDEGRGLPEGFDPGRSESLGMILVHSLAAQLRGSVEYRSYKGAEGILRFPIE
jgi:PAS domain S-box-containing protein